MRKIIFYGILVLILVSCTTENSDLKINENQSEAYKSYLQTVDDNTKYKSYNSTIVSSYGFEKKGIQIMRTIVSDVVKQENDQIIIQGEYAEDESNKCSFYYDNTYMYVGEKKVKFQFPISKLNYDALFFGIKKEEISKMEFIESKDGSILYNIYLNVNEIDKSKYFQDAIFENVLIHQIKSITISIQTKVDGSVITNAFGAVLDAEIDGVKEKIDYGFSIGYLRYNKISINQKEVGVYEEIDYADRPSCMIY